MEQQQQEQDLLQLLVQMQENAAVIANQNVSLTAKNAALEKLLQEICGIGPTALRSELIQIGTNFKERQLANRSTIVVLSSQCLALKDCYNKLHEDAMTMINNANRDIQSFQHVIPIFVQQIVAKKDLTNKKLAKSENLARELQMENVVMKRKLEGIEKAFFHTGNTLKLLAVAENPISKLASSEASGSMVANPRVSNTSSQPRASTVSYTRSALTSKTASVKSDLHAVKIELKMALGDISERLNLLKILVCSIRNYAEKTSDYADKTSDGGLKHNQSDSPKVKQLETDKQNLKLAYAAKSKGLKQAQAFAVKLIEYLDQRRTSEPSNDVPPHFQFLLQLFRPDFDVGNQLNSMKKQALTTLLKFAAEKPVLCLDWLRAQSVGGLYPTLNNFLLTNSESWLLKYLILEADNSINLAAAQLLLSLVPYSKLEEQFNAAVNWKYDNPFTMPLASIPTPAQTVLNKVGKILVNLFHSAVEQVQHHQAERNIVTYLVLLMVCLNGNIPDEMIDPFFHSLSKMYQSHLLRSLPSFDGKDFQKQEQLQPKNIEAVFALWYSVAARCPKLVRVSTESHETMSAFLNVTFKYCVVLLRINVFPKGPRRVFLISYFHLVQLFCCNCHVFCWNFVQHDNFTDAVQFIFLTKCRPIVNAAVSMFQNICSVSNPEIKIPAKLKLWKSMLGYMEKSKQNYDMVLRVIAVCLLSEEKGWLFLLNVQNGCLEIFSKILGLLPVNTIVTVQIENLERDFCYLMDQLRLLLVQMLTKNELKVLTSFYEVIRKFAATIRKEDYISDPVNRSLERLELVLNSGKFEELLKQPGNKEKSGGTSNSSNDQTTTRKQKAGSIQSTGAESNLLDKNVQPHQLKKQKLDSWTPGNL